MRRAVFLALVVLVGCSTTHETGRAPRLEPPPARSGEPLTKDQALALAKDPDAEQAIDELDAHRLGFVLDAPTIVWFEKEGATPEALDYLSKRTRVDWEGLRGDVDPGTPEAEYIDPRRGFDDWAGFGRHEGFMGLGMRSRDPFAR
jgi:hypothetical protein